ncbi:MAG TPA: AbgT family transporter [Acidimicrobiia bacterium]|jgi:aminobenzoyl-glutamate transport protein|nr:transporter ATPase [Acidimicrobiia bacterium]HYJ25774.1 AbgT family transporter [Acidimicrobiia bacterium]
MDATTVAEKRPFSERMLDGIEKAGNKVPHPVMMFVYLIIFIAVLSAVLSWIGVTVTEEIAVPVPQAESVDAHGGLGGSDAPYDSTPLEPNFEPEYEIETQTIEVQSLLDVEGLRFVFTSFVNNFAGFSVVAVTFVAMAGVGVAEHAGLMAALIRKLVKVAPRNVIAFILIFVGVLSSVASDAGYLILIPLGAAAFLTLGRHPLAGMAAAFAGVGAIFGVNLLITPIDSMLTEITNEAIPAGTEPLTVTANYFFSVASSVVLAVIAMFVTQRIVEKRLGPYDAAHGAADATTEALDGEALAAEARGLRFALYGLLGSLAVIALLTFPSGAPLRDPVTGSIVGTTPFMDSLLFLITLIFLVCGIFYGMGAKSMSGSGDVIAGVTKTFAGLAGLVFMLLMISQFIAYFNYTNLPRVAAIEMAHLLETANIGGLALLIGFILVIVILDFILPGVVPKWAIFAPVFIPIFIRLGVTPQTVLAAYRVGDSPVNVITPLMVYLPFIVTIAQRYRRDAGIGTVVALMIPFVIAILIAWILLFVIWFWLGIPLGPGYPITT